VTILNSTFLELFLIILCPYRLKPVLAFNNGYDRAVIHDLRYKIGVLEFENVWLGLEGSVSMMGIRVS
jgi:hypothetical protein